MKRLLLIFIVIVGLGKEVEGQTNVGGTISTNTTWTLANSPYFVTSAIYVNPGITLTIEPGVVVRTLPYQYIQIGGTLIANGTATDSIKFTDSTAVPLAGYWGDFSSGAIIVDLPQGTASFNYCIFENAQSWIFKYFTYTTNLKKSTFRYSGGGIYQASKVVFDSLSFFKDNIAIDRLDSSLLRYSSISNCIYGLGWLLNDTISNCIFNDNSIALSESDWGHGLIRNSKITNCIFKRNELAIYALYHGNIFENSIIDSNTYAGFHILDLDIIPDTIINCEIKYNNYGIYPEENVKITITLNDIEYNNIGIYSSDSSATIYCNKICSNINYGFYANTPFNLSASNNYWCTTDSIQIEAAIYDCYDGSGGGCITFMPVDNSVCYLSTGISAIQNSQSEISISPNPFSSSLSITIQKQNVKQAVINITNTLGQNVFYKEESNLSSSYTKMLDLSFLPPGVYFLQLILDGEPVVKKVVKE